MNLKIAFNQNLAVSSIFLLEFFYLKKALAPMQLYEMLVKWGTTARVGRKIEKKKRKRFQNYYNYF